MSEGRRQRAAALAGGRPLVSADLATVAWLSGLVTDIEIGPSFFSQPPVAILDPSGSVLVVTSEGEAEGVADGVETRAFPGFAVEDVDRPGEAARLVLDALDGAGSLAVETASLPGSIAVELSRRGVELVDVTGEIQRARAVKDEDEVKAIRASISIADAGQAAARSGFAAGASELELWASTRAAMELAAGSRLPVLADLLTGERTAEVGGPPSDRVAGEGDLLLVDLVPRLGAYWADSCATVALGEASPEAVQAHDAARRALERAVSMCRPGARVADIDAAARETVAEAGGEYPHHTGHGLGTAFHEEPRVIGGTDRILEAGMVIALEPGAYGDGWGVRVEQVVLVTDGEPEILSGHVLAL
jgi:Xaa-Pro dipeptidase